MDIFCEYIVKKEKTIKDVVKQTGIVFLALILSLVFLILNNMLYGFGFLLIVGVIYGAIFLIRKTNIEYEYILTNSVLDIDAIYSKSSRKRMESIDFKNIEAFGKGIDAPKSPAKVCDYTGNITNEDVYYIELFKNGEKKRIFFQPNGKILKNLHLVAPKMVPVYEGIEE